MNRVAGVTSGLMHARFASWRTDVARVDDGGASLPERDARPQHPPFALETRYLRLTDVPQLRRVPHVYRLHQPETQLTPYSPLRAGLRAATPGVRSRRPFFVASTGERLVGFAQFMPVHPDQRWHLVALGASVGVYDVLPVWEALLGHGVRSAGLRGVKRLYARSLHGSLVASALHALAWMPYASERVFVGYDVHERAAPLDARAQETSDTWAIHQLYNAAVPREVQHAEAYTSHRWDLHGQATTAHGVVKGWLIEDRHNLIGYARTTSRRDVHLVDLVYHPEHIDVIASLFQTAVAHLSPQPLRRVYCSARGYQVELATALETSGFRPVLEQDLHVKYTTATVRAPVGEPIPFHLEVRDKLPQRVPTFLHGAAPDHSASIPGVRGLDSGSGVRQ